MVQDRIYVSTRRPLVYSTTASFVWRSVDHGMSFSLVRGNAPPLGRLRHSFGGGDSGWRFFFRRSQFGRYFGRLRKARLAHSKTNVRNSDSKGKEDGDYSPLGATLVDQIADLPQKTKRSGPSVDRPAFGDPRQAESFTRGPLHQVERSCIGACQPNLGEVGSNIVEDQRRPRWSHLQLLSPRRQIEPGRNRFWNS